jgi:energy-coupling factor transporter ATP-binding protein EcfA2
VRPGEIVGILGESGAGKSTLVRHLIGLLRPTAGEIRIGDLDASRASVAHLAATVGYVFQNPLHQLFAETVAAEIAFGPLACGWARSAVDSRVDDLLARFGLERYRERHPLALSEGERRRVALAATLATRPRLLVLDEPTVGQDGGEKARLGSLLRELASAGDSALVVTHDVEFAAAHCERVVVLAGGAVLADGPASEILARSDLLDRAALEAPQLARLAALSRIGYDSGPNTAMTNGAADEQPVGVGFVPTPPFCRCDAVTSPTPAKRAESSQPNDGERPVAGDAS